MANKDPVAVAKADVDDDAREVGAQPDAVWAHE